MVMPSHPMPARMRSHADCLQATMALEIEPFGKVLGDSIVEPLNAYSWWPFAEEPPSMSLDLREPRPTPSASKVPPSR